MMSNYALTIYPILWLLMTFAGVKYSGRQTISKDFMSIEQTKLIRGCACIGVILHHITQLVTQYGSVNRGPVTIFNHAGFLFTALFFFFSGYGLIINVYNKRDYLHTFLTKRLPAVLIPFWLVNAAAVMIKLFVLHHRYIPVDVFQYIVGLKLLNSNGWFIIEIVIIYLAFFILFDLIKKKDVALVLLCVFVLLIIRFAFFRGHDPVGAKTSWFRGEWWFNSTITFVFGMLIARFKNDLVPLLSRFYVCIMPASFVLFVCTFAQAIYMNMNYGYYGSLTVGASVPGMIKTLIWQSVACIAFSLFVLMLNLRLKFGNPVLSYISTISMELFLIHGYFVAVVSEKMKLKEFPRYAVIIALSVAATAIVAPVIGFIKRKIIGVTGRLEIYDLFPAAAITEKIKIEKNKISSKYLAVGVFVLAVLAVMFLAGRSLFLKQEFNSEYNTLIKAKAGDEVLWGRFQTDDIPGRERLSWIVLQNDGDSLFLITKEGIAASHYNQKHENVSWEESDIRSVINDDRFINIFSKEELAQMLMTDGDYISLITEQEACEYFDSDVARQLAITEAALHEGSNINTLSKANQWDMKGYRSSWWWLRTDGDDADVYAPIVTVDGDISKKEVNRPGGAIRPVIRIKLTKS